MASRAWLRRNACRATADNERAQAVAALLPDGHPARAWAAGEAIAIEKAMLIDLGDAGAVKEAYGWMKSPKSPENPGTVDLA